MNKETTFNAMFPNQSLAEIEAAKEAELEAYLLEQEIAYQNSVRSYYENCGAGNTY